MVFVTGIGPVFRLVDVVVVTRLRCCVLLLDIVDVDVCDRYVDLCWSTEEDGCVSGAL
jgi:hypothetical protein